MAATPNSHAGCYEGLYQDAGEDIVLASLRRAQANRPWWIRCLLIETCSESLIDSHSEINKIISEPLNYSGALL